MAQAATLLPSGQTPYEFLTNVQLFNIIKTGENSELFEQHFRNEEGSFCEPVSVFYYYNKARIQFTVTSSFQRHFVLIKGLIEFSRPKDMKFEFDFESKRFTIDIDTNNFSQLASLLAFVYRNIINELRFKATLKKVIQFENQHRLQMNEIYSDLHSSGKSIDHFFESIKTF